MVKIIIRWGNGQIYYFAAPSIEHQEILGVLHATIYNYLQKEKGPCKIYITPAVYLKKDDTTYVEPDIAVICDPEKIVKKGCKGAPDWIIEIVSPSNSLHDYVEKLSQYLKAGVREYWIVDPIGQRIATYFFEAPSIRSYVFTETVPVDLFERFSIDFSQLDSLTL